jgi:serralysin
MPLPIYTNDQIAAQLTTGYANYQNTVYTPVGYTIEPSHWNITTGGSISVDITALAANGQFFATAALQMWSMVTGINFNFVSSGAQLFFDDDGSSSAYETDTYSNGVTMSAEIHISYDWIVGPTSDDSGNLNSFSYQTYLHEIGHALGLGHAGNYNSDATFSTTAGTGNTISVNAGGANQGANGLFYDDVTGHNQYLNDSWQASIMSYFSQQGNSPYDSAAQSINTYTSADFAYVMTPMVADIIAVNTLYGTPTTAHLGNTTYGFNSSLTGTVFDAAAFTGVSFTILDNGGVDTLDYSGYTQAQVLNLNAETYSNVGGVVGAVSIARGTVVENAIGGTGADVLTGNSAGNILKGGLGIDTLDGAGGVDTADYSDKTTAVVVTLNSATAATVTIGGSAEDTVMNIENLIGGSGQDNFVGDSLANRLDGGLGNDSLNGGIGADILVGGGGNDTIIGGADSDTAIFTGAFASYAVSYNSSTSTFTLTSSAEGVDTVTGVEYFQFSDVAKTAASLMPAPTISASIAATTASANEGNSGTTTFTFTVTLATAATSAQSATYTVAGNGTNATNATDFSGALTGTVSFAIGETSKTITVLIAGDTTVEQNETFGVTLSSPTSGLVIGTASATATILNDDVAGPNIMNGTTGIDNLVGTAGADQIDGLAGNDYLDGSAGNDILIGGLGNDAFIFNALNMTSGQSDSISDFSATADGTGDTIRIVGIANGKISVAASGLNAVVGYDNGSIVNTVIINNAGAKPVYVSEYSSTANALTGNLANAFLFVSDAMNQSANSWSNFTKVYDAQAVLDYQNTVNDDGTKSTIDYDNANNQTYTSISDYFDTQNILDSRTVLLDNGTQNKQYFDHLSANSWSSISDNYNSSSALINEVTNFDNGTRQALYLDAQSNQSWSSILDSFSAANVMTYETIVYDASNRSTQFFDHLANQTWTNILQNFDNLSHLLNETTAYDNGTRQVNYIDALSNQSWSNIIDLFHTTGVLKTETTNYDNGARQVYYADYLNANAWANITDNYDSLNRLDTELVRNDNLSYSFTDYDQANLNTWSQDVLVYNTAQVLSQHYRVMDDNSIVVL